MLAAPVGPVGPVTVDAAPVGPVGPVTVLAAPALVNVMKVWLALPKETEPSMYVTVMVVYVPESVTLETWNRALTGVAPVADTIQIRSPATSPLRSVVAVTPGQSV